MTHPRDLWYITRTYGTFTPNSDLTGIQPYQAIQGPMAHSKDLWHIHSKLLFNMNSALLHNSKTYDTSQGPRAYLYDTHILHIVSSIRQSKDI